MSDEQAKDTTKRFRVRVGHTAVDVDGCDRDDAINQARRRMSADMPRLWDVIYKMDVNEFSVDEMNG